MARQVINDGDSGLTVRNNLNAMFTELYSAIVVPIKLPAVSASTTLVIPANTFIHDIFIADVSGSPDVRIGTTPNGTDIVGDGDPGASGQTSVEQYFATDTTLYITLAGTLPVVNIRINVEPNFY